MLTLGATPARAVWRPTWHMPWRRGTCRGAVAQGHGWVRCQARVAAASEVRLEGGELCGKEAQMPKPTRRGAASPSST